MWSTSMGRNRCSGRCTAFRTRPSTVPPGARHQPDYAGLSQQGADPAVDSYSGFFDNARKHATGLEDFLRKAGVQTVYLLGLATDYCVQATALDAVSLGFQTFVVEDGCRAVDLKPGDGRRALERMRSAGVQVVRSDQVIASRAARTPKTSNKASPTR